MSRKPILFIHFESFYLHLCRESVLSLRRDHILQITDLPVIQNRRIQLLLATELGKLFHTLVKRLIQMPGQTSVNKFLLSYWIYSRRHQFRYSSESRVININEHTTSIQSIHFHATAPFMLTGSIDAAKLWWLNYQNGLTPTCIATIQGNELSHFKGLAFHPTENLMVTNTVQNIPVLWRFSYDDTSGCTLTRLAWLHVHKCTVFSVDFHKRLPFFATGSLDAYVVVWELLPEKPYVKCVCSFSHGSKVFCVAFHPSLPLIATSGYDDVVRLWRLPSETSRLSLLATLIGHTHWIHSVTFDRTGQFLATGCQDHTIKLWRLSESDFTVTCLATLSGHTDAVNSVSFHQTGPFMVSTSMDRTVKVWRLSRNFSSATCIAEKKSDIDDLAICADFDPHTKSLVFGTKQNQVNLLN
jgi:WD40 repeat protein